MSIYHRNALRLIFCLVLGAAANPVQSASNSTITTGQPVFAEDFEKPGALKSWQGVRAGQAELTPGRNGSPCLRIASTGKEDKPAVMIRKPLSLETYRGAQLQCRALVKAEGVAKPPNAWNGIKFMLILETSDGREHPQQRNVYGTFDWKTVSFETVVPKDLKGAEVCLGLEQTTGTVWFDDIQITVAGLPRTRPASPAAGPMYKGHNLPRLRGAMIGPRLTEDDLRNLGGNWKANHVRWQLIWGGFPRSPADKGDLAAYDQWFNSELERLDRMLPVCRELGMLALIDLHTPPGGRNDDKQCRIFHEKRFQNKFVEVWERLAKRYRDNPTVWGYDLVNEPVEGTVGEGLMNWQTLAEHTAAMVRKLDPGHAIIIEPAPWGSAESLNRLQPLKIPGVVYSVHMYQPHDFTHQGVYGKPTGIVYPGPVAGKLWNKERLRQAFQPVRDFQLDYNVHIYIGEFSAIRWAPGDSAYTYLRDVIEIMEEYDWDWAYHAYREWSGWSVEHGPDPKDTQPVSTPTQRQQLLGEWFAKNQKNQIPP